MIKNHSLLILVSLFAVSMPLMAAKPKGLGKRSVTPPGFSTKADAQDKKEAAEQPAALSAEKSANVAVAAASPIGNPTDKKQVTLEDLMKRNTSVFSPLTSSAQKKCFGADVIVIGALGLLKESEEELDCSAPANQAELGKAVAAIVASKKVNQAKELMTVLKEKGLFLEKTNRTALRKMLKEQRKEKQDKFSKEHEEQRKALKEGLVQHITESRELDSLVDLTFEQGGAHNLTGQELTAKQKKQVSLTKKNAERSKAGLSDNEEEHPEYVSPDTIFKIETSKLFSMKASQKSIHHQTA